MNKQTGSKIHILTILAGILLAGILIALIVLMIKLGDQEAPRDLPEPTAELTIIPAPTQTQVINLPTDPVQTPTTATESVPEGAIAVGAYVKVTGTEGAGLRMRTEPGTSSAIMFVAMDEEVFLVIGGPEEVDGYVWYQLEAPYDESRTGWSADAFLTLIEEQQP